MIEILLKNCKIQKLNHDIFMKKYLRNNCDFGILFEKALDKLIEDTLNLCIEIFRTLYANMLNKIDLEKSVLKKLQDFGRYHEAFYYGIKVLKN